VAWALTSGLGSLTGQASTTTVTYNAPTTVTVASTAVVTATSKTDPTKSATFTINLGPATVDHHDDSAGGNCKLRLYRHRIDDGRRASIYMGTGGRARRCVTWQQHDEYDFSTRNAHYSRGNQDVTIKVTDAQGLSVTSSGVNDYGVAAPVITGFTPVAATITAGTSTNLTATFSNGTGSVNNGVGAVVSGTPVPVTQRRQLRTL